MNKQIYIHYGAAKFDSSIGFPIRNVPHWTKPSGGLWASRKNAMFGWRDWCYQEDFLDCDIFDSFEFVLRDESKIAVINNLSQLYRLPKIKNLENPETGFYIQSSYLIDFEKCVRSGIDAIELCWYGNEGRDITSNDLHHALYGWDCDSIIVLNPDAVITR